MALAHARSESGVHEAGLAMTVHHLLVTEGTVWTLTLDVWHRGGGV